MKRQYNDIIRYNTLEYTGLEAMKAVEIMKGAIAIMWDGMGSLSDYNKRRIALGYPLLQVNTCYAIQVAGEAQFEYQVARKLRSSISNSLGGHKDVELWLKAKVCDLKGQTVSRLELQAYRIRWMQEMLEQLKQISIHGRGYF